MYMYLKYMILSNKSFVFKQCGIKNNKYIACIHIYMYNCCFLSLQTYENFIIIYYSIIIIFKIFQNIQIYFTFSMNRGNNTIVLLFVYNIFKSIS